MPVPPPAFKFDADDGERLRFSDADFVVGTSADSTGSVSARNGITWLDR